MVLYHFQTGKDDRFVWLAGGPEPEAVAPDSAEPVNTPETKPAADTTVVEMAIDNAETETTAQAIVKARQDDVFREIEQEVQNVSGRIRIFMENLSGPVRGAVERKIDEIAERKLYPLAVASRSRIGIAVRNSMAWLRMSSGTSEDMAWLTKKITTCDEALAGLNREKSSADSELRAWKDAQKRLGSKRWMPRPDKSYRSWRVSIRAEKNRTPLKEMITDIRKVAQSRKVQLERNVREELGAYGVVETNFRRLFFTETQKKNPELFRNFEEMLKAAMLNGDPGLQEIIESLDDSAKKDMLQGYYDELMNRKGHIWYETQQNTLYEDKQRIAPSKLNKLPVGRYVDVKYNEQVIGKDKDGKNNQVLEHKLHSIEAYVIPTLGSTGVVTMQVVDKKLITTPKFPEKVVINLAKNKVTLIGREEKNGKIVEKSPEEYDLNPASDNKQRISFEAYVPSNF